MALHNAQSWVRRQAAPITLSIVASLAIAGLTWLIVRPELGQIALTQTWQRHPWTLVTYPWAMMPFGNGLALIGFLFLAMWILWTGASIEREIGPGKYIGLWISMILLPALAIVVVGTALSTRFGASGMWLPGAGITIVWCTRNPSATIMIWGIIPLSGKWLGWLTVIGTVALAGFGNPLTGLVCALHLPIAWAFAANKLPIPYSKGREMFGRKAIESNPNLLKRERLDKSYFDDVKKREKERDERERLRKLFESSVNENEPPKDR